MNQRALFGMGLPDLDLVVDLSNLVYRAALSRNFRDLTHEGRPSGHVYGAFSMILSLKRHWAKGRRVRFVWAVDMPCSWRRALDPQYKANRGAGRLGSGVMDDVMGLVTCVPGLTTSSLDHEADDVIAAHTSRPDRQYVVFSGDRDLWQLIDRSNVQVVRATKDRPVGLADVREAFWTDRPALVPIAKAVTGDTSDNIQAAFPRFNRDDLAAALADTRAPTADAFLEAVDRLEKPKPSTKGYVLDGDKFRHFERNVQLATLVRDCPVDVRVHRPDRDRLEAGLLAFGCRSIVARADELYTGAP